MRKWMTVMVLSAALCGCGDNDADSGDSGATSVTDTASPQPLSGACKLAAQELACAACYDGEVTCAYGEESVTVGSCGDCQSRLALYDQLCASGIEDSREDIEAGIVCSDPA